MNPQLRFIVLVCAGIAAIGCSKPKPEDKVPELYEAMSSGRPVYFSNGRYIYDGSIRYIYNGRVRLESEYSTGNAYSFADVYLTKQEATEALIEQIREDLKAEEGK